jgi:hypothetical protein
MGLSSPVRQLPNRRAVRTIASMLADGVFAGIEDLIINMSYTKTVIGTRSGHQSWIAANVR